MASGHAAFLLFLFLLFLLLLFLFANTTMREKE